MKDATTDDLLRRVLQMLLRKRHSVAATRGANVEHVGVMLRLTNPRARLSHTEIKGKVFSAIGELLWYLSGKNDLKTIQYYISDYKKDSEDGATVYGGYVTCPPQTDPVPGWYFGLDQGGSGDGQEAIRGRRDREQAA